MEYTQNNEMFIQNCLLKFRLGSDYSEEKRLYQNSLKFLSENIILSQILQIERLLQKKIRIEILYVYQKVTEKIGNKIVCNCTTYEDFNIDSLNLNNLYNTNLSYYKLELSLKKARNDLRKCISNEKKTYIESLFEIYNDCNYEILKYAYIISYNKNELDMYKCSQLNANLLGLKIKKCRKDIKLTQDDLGILLDTKRYNISNYERGKTTPPISIILMYSKIFNVSLQYLLDDDIPIEAKNVFYIAA